MVRLQTNLYAGSSKGCDGSPISLAAVRIKNGDADLRNVERPDPPWRNISTAATRWGNLNYRNRNTRLQTRPANPKRECHEDREADTEHLLSSESLSV